jgi:hypothetical protein
VQQDCGHRLAGELGRELSGIDGAEQPGAHRGAQDRVPVRVRSFDWMVPLSGGDTTVRVIDADSVGLGPRGVNGVERIRVGSDTLEVDLRGSRRGTRLTSA